MYLYFLGFLSEILLAICEQAAETNNVYKRHRIIKIYHLFVSLLMNDIKSGLGGAWAFVLEMLFIL